MNLNKKVRPRRSFIFTPGLKPEMFPKALRSGVDMVCIELEDGIAPKDKNEAREKALSIFQKQTIPENIEVILPNLHHKHTGVTSTVSRLLPILEKSMVIVSTGVKLSKQGKSIPLWKPLFISRKKLYDKLISSGIKVNVHYIPIYKHKMYKDLGYDQSKFPEAGIEETFLTVVPNSDEETT